jgi:hypothetical protein
MAFRVSTTSVPATAVSALCPRELGGMNGGTDCLCVVSCNLVETETVAAAFGSSQQSHRAALHRMVAWCY